MSGCCLSTHSKNLQYCRLINTESRSANYNRFLLGYTSDVLQGSGVVDSSEGWQHINKLANNVAPFPVLVFPQIMELV